ncbi:FAD-dependent oxidoreductase [Tsuneonella deserti]|uniref:FAD-dependent oxidoreductase n=1 Tax=Tsuneonella deserti TaxID=2035528 RepID=A0ABQ1S076_9SPHN|nr:FAD-dependent oxidoreductase [Tsuneonella deserti]GGD84959.1 FAD-dependent oxidoreductase [Tsuneonella deserti]
MHIAIIGAGIAGLACADGLTAAGHSVALFDKARGAGGRMSTRRLQTPAGEVAVDHGAQYFTVRDTEFSRQVAVWANLGLAEPWPIAGPDAWVGVPRMNSVVGEMARRHDVTWNCVVQGLVRDQGRFHLACQTGQRGPFDAAVLAIPAEQAAVILSLHDLEMTRLALGARSQPCWAAMFAFEPPLADLPGALRSSGAIAWAAGNKSRPGRTGPEAWVVQASPGWSRERLDWRAEHVAQVLLEEFSLITGSDNLHPIAGQAHLWRYALSAGTGDGALWNPALRLGVCGDWLLGPRVECAWMSGRLLAGKMSARPEEARQSVSLTSVTCDQ